MSARRTWLYDQTSILAIIVICYLLSYAVVIWISMPFNDFMLARLGFGSVIYLPHGVSILVFWMFRWPGAAYLIVAKLFASSVLFIDSATGPLALIFQLESVLAIICAFYLGRRVWGLMHSESETLPSWRDLMIVSALAAAFHAGVYKLFAGSSWGTASEIFLGNVFGMFVTLIILMLAFRAFRKSSPKKAS